MAPPWPSPTRGVLPSSRHAQPGRCPMWDRAGDGNRWEPREGKNVELSQKNMFHFLLVLQPPAYTPPPARSLPMHQRSLALPAQALVCTQRACNAHVWACSGCTGQRGCMQHLGSSNAGAHLLLHPTALPQGGRVLPHRSLPDAEGPFPSLCRTGPCWWGWTRPRMGLCPHGCCSP